MSVRRTTLSHTNDVVLGFDLKYGLSCMCDNDEEFDANVEICCDQLLVAVEEEETKAAMRKKMTFDTNNAVKLEALARVQTEH